jgi:hypothetical protein
LAASAARHLVGSDGVRIRGRQREVIRRELTVGSTVTAALVLIYIFLPMDGRFWWVAILTSLVIVVSIVPWTVRRVRDILVSERPMLESAVVIGLVFVLLVMAFSIAYYTLERHSGGQFSELHTKLDAVYFVVTTLATVGFGDVHASGQFARALVSMQMIFDFAFLGLTLRVITSAARHRMEQTGSGPSHLI